MPVLLILGLGLLSLIVILLIFVLCQRGGGSVRCKLRSYGRCCAESNLARENTGMAASELTEVTDDIASSHIPRCHVTYSEELMPDPMEANVRRLRRLPESDQPDSSYSL